MTRPRNRARMGHVTGVARVGLVDPQDLQAQGVTDDWEEFVTLDVLDPMFNY
jgi:hypothetical protein